MSGTFEHVKMSKLICIHVHTYVLYAPVCACVYCFQSRPSNIYFICTPLNLCWAVFNCVFMWLPMGIYGISSICQLSQQVHPISQIHSCESKGELWLNNVILLIQLMLVFVDLPLLVSMCVLVYVHIYWMLLL